ncbi:hypothetical protein J2W42_005146 [Rhizobium tibeticum]|nr:hypothetical protein [Rhizobium tibeticum]
MGIFSKRNKGLAAAIQEFVTIGTWINPCNLCKRSSFPS